MASKFQIIAPNGTFIQSPCDLQEWSPSGVIAKPARDALMRRRDGRGEVAGWPNARHAPR
jgi:hypothetical protein